MFESLGLMLRISLQRFAQHDRSEDSQAMTWRSNLKRRLNSSADLRVLLLLFVATALVFSALPLLRYFRGRALFDYELWYDTGQHVLSGHEIYFFRSGKYDFMYPPPGALFLAAWRLLRPARLIFFMFSTNSATSCSDSM